MKPAQARRRVAAVVLPPVLRIDQITVKIAAAGVVAGLGGFFAMTQRKPEPCSLCGGAGNWGCVICDGEGFMVDGRSRKKCVACVGRGKRICRECEGSGWNKKTNYIVRGRWPDTECFAAATTRCRLCLTILTLSEMLTCKHIHSTYVLYFCRDDDVSNVVKKAIGSNKVVQVSLSRSELRMRLRLRGRSASL